MKRRVNETPRIIPGIYSRHLFPAFVPGICSRHLFPAVNCRAIFSRPCGTLIFALT
jgi:hypothetical protein